MKSLLLSKSLTLLSLALFVSCASEDQVQANVENYEEPISDLKTLLSDKPAGNSLPDELKADQVFPKQFDLMDTQSTVKNQGSRGVCSIFSTVALMEHLYIKKGAVQPDFSEQFLQWSVKAELGKFTDTSGSNGSANLEAINRFGIVDESTYPYQSYPWTTANDAACTGEKQPYQCYTNGEPTAEIKAAKRYKLSSSRWIDSSVQNIKAFMYENKSAVVAGMEFFYQSWNHGRSPLPTSYDYKAKGYVLYPNETDITKSREMGAGHSILIVGWDDELEVPMMDAEGKQILDENGQPKVEKGFFLFKNSWGTGVFGTSNPFGSGYGWLSMRYVEEFGSVVSARPLNENFVESCDDQLDNNFDGKVDCDDVTCAENDRCKVPVVQADQFKVESAELNTTIPDFNEAGISSVLSVEQSGLIDLLTVKIEINHTYQEDLSISLVHPNGTRVLVIEAEGRNESVDVISKEITDFNGTDVKGNWTLEVRDLAKNDEGQLVKWSLEGKLKAE